MGAGWGGGGRFEGKRTRWDTAVSNEVMRNSLIWWSSASFCWISARKSGAAICDSPNPASFYLVLGR